MLSGLPLQCSHHSKNSGYLHLLVCHAQFTLVGPNHTVTRATFPFQNYPSLANDTATRNRCSGREPQDHCWVLARLHSPSAMPSDRGPRSPAPAATALPQKHHCLPALIRAPPPSGNSQPGGQRVSLRPDQILLHRHLDPQTISTSSAIRATEPWDLTGLRSFPRHLGLTRLPTPLPCSLHLPGT